MGTRAGYAGMRTGYAGTRTGYAQVTRTGYAGTRTGYAGARTGYAGARTGYAGTGNWHGSGNHNHHGHHNGCRNVVFVGGYPYYGFGWGFPYYDYGYGYYGYYPYDNGYYYGNEGQVYEGQVYDGQVPDRQAAPDGKDVSLVLQVQRRLARGGYYHGTIDGVIGGGTRGAIRAYERSHRLPVDGIIDDNLLATMGAGHNRAVVAD